MSFEEFKTYLLILIFIVIVKYVILPILWIKDLFSSKRERNRDTETDH